MIRTRFTELFGLTRPVMSAPMALHSGGTLAAAVSAAGGLGSFGGVHPSGGPAWIDAEIRRIRSTTERPFAVGFITPFLGFTEALLDAALAGGAAAIAFSFSDPGPWADRCREAGARIICQVQTFVDVDLAMDAGADVLVVQGNEAGGHTGAMGLLPFLAGVVDQDLGVPVLAAGGIADGRTLAAALTAGADGAWMGTAFLATPEAVEVHDVHKDLIVASDGGDTVFTRAYDIVSGFPWPAGIGERVRRNRFTEEWDEREGELRGQRDRVAAQEPRQFEGPPDPERGAVLYGQSARFVDAVRPAADVLARVCDEAEHILRTRPGSLLS